MLWLTSGIISNCIDTKESEMKASPWLVVFLSTALSSFEAFVFILVSCLFRIKFHKFSPQTRLPCWGVWKKVSYSAVKKKRKKKYGKILF